MATSSASHGGRPAPHRPRPRAACPAPLQGRQPRRPQPTGRRGHQTAGGTPLPEALPHPQPLVIQPQTPAGNWSAELAGQWPQPLSVPHYGERLSFHLPHLGRGGLAAPLSPEMPLKRGDPATGLQFCLRPSPPRGVTPTSTDTNPRSVWISITIIMKIPQFPPDHDT